MDQYFSLPHIVRLESARLDQHSSFARSSVSQASSLTFSPRNRFVPCSTSFRFLNEVLPTSRPIMSNLVFSTLGSDALTPFTNPTTNTSTSSVPLVYFMDTSNGTAETNDALAAVLTVAMNLESAVRRQNPGSSSLSTMFVDNPGKDEETVVAEPKEENLSMPLNNLSNSLRPLLVSSYCIQRHPLYAHISQQVFYESTLHIPTTSLRSTTNRLICMTIGFILRQCLKPDVGTPMTHEYKRSLISRCLHLCHPFFEIITIPLFLFDFMLMTSYDSISHLYGALLCVSIVYSFARHTDIL